MKISTKVVLLSGLVFPGIGHFVLKQRLRGSVLMVTALIASAIIVKIAVQRAMALIDKINSGQIAIDSGTITELVSNSVSTTDNSTVNLSAMVLVACWLFAIIDSYRLGMIQEKKNL